MLGVSYRTLMRWERKEVAPRKFKIGRPVRYLRSDVREWQIQNTEPAPNLVGDPYPAQSHERSDDLDVDQDGPVTRRTLESMATPCSVNA